MDPFLYWFVTFWWATLERFYRCLMTVVEEDGQNVWMFFSGGANFRGAGALRNSLEGPKSKKDLMICVKVAFTRSQMLTMALIKTLEDLRRNNRVRHSVSPMFTWRTALCWTTSSKSRKRKSVSRFLRTNLNTVCTRMARKAPCRFCSYGERDIMMGVSGVLGKMVMLFFWTCLMAYAVSSSGMFFWTDPCTQCADNFEKSFIIWKKIFTCLILHKFFT